VMCMLQLKGVPISEFKCKYLTLELHMKKFNLYVVAGFLRASPHVETLNIDMKTMSMIPFSTLLKIPSANFELLNLAKGDDMDLLSLVPSFVFPNLKTVKIFISPERCLKDHVEWGFDKLFNLLKFLLKNATVLEEFVIISKRRM
ncbi:hypothetical protein HAX54_034263, partial [Datura stramonium]|nr:hypothetical protein [Datura stramonium]